MENLPLITIAIPTYNRSSLVVRAVKSALAQTYSNIEVLVSDNASTDDTLEALAHFNDPRLRFIRHPQNMGLWANWNACLANARGEYLVVVSDDDVIFPAFLERCGGLIVASPGLPLVLAVTSESRFTGLAEDPATTHLKTGIYPGFELAVEYLSQRLQVQMCGVLIKTEIARRNGGFPSDRPFCGDVALWFPVLAAGTVGFIREPSGVYTCSLQNTTHTMGMAPKFEDLRRLRDDVILDRWKMADHGWRMDILDKLARRYCANSTMSQLRQFRDQGGRLSSVVKYLFAARNNFTMNAVQEYFELYRPGTVVHLLLPPRMTAWLRRLFPVSGPGGGAAARQFGFF